MKIGVLGAGYIAGKIAPTWAAMPAVERYAVASRSAEKAAAFAEKYGFSKAYGSYEEMLCDPAVELVYVATPHAQHFAHMMLCIAHGKPVLCEKSFTLNAQQAREVQRAAAEKGVFAAEAIWTRYMPSRKVITEVMSSGIIGTPRILTANLCYAITHKERVMEAALGGGALLDIGVYGVNFALMCFGTDIERVETAAQLTDTGVDAAENITLFYRDGRTAVLTHSICCRSDRRGVICGDKGYMVVENINDPQSLRVYDSADREVACYDFTEEISDYAYEFAECIEAVAAGEREAPSMPLADTVFVMELMDGLREKWGMAFPQER